MEIAPGIDSTVWKSLTLDDPKSADWERAIDIFRSRLESRFIEAVDELIELEKLKPSIDKRFGFAILAIDCLLVETLGAFVKGWPETRRRGQSEEAFCTFLSRPLFAPHFSPATASQFYAEFRCGLLHQAEVGGTSRVWSVGSVINLDSGRITVNRTKFHELLKQEFAMYQAELKDPMNGTIRSNFRHKMDFICDR